MKQEEIEKSKDRLKILKKMEEYERDGKFDIDLEDDPPTIPLKPGEATYFRKSIISKLHANFATYTAIKFFNKAIKNGQIVIKTINGHENMEKLNNTGYFITCNHFNPFDCFTVESVFRNYRKKHSKKLYKVIREGNYTNFPGFFGYLMKNCYTLPLAKNINVMIEFTNGIKDILKNKDAILIYPEESLWWNYRKPKPLKNGAFNLAVKNNVPVLPIFITMEDTDKIGEDGFPIQAYTVNIGKPIYPEENKSKKENIEIMKNKNFEYWKETYEKFYNKKLVYTTKKSNNEK